MAIDKDELNKLPPAERIKRLKELEEERKKEIDEAEDLIKRTESELEEIRKLPDIRVPRLEPVDISRLFEAAEGLETTVARSQVDIAEETTTQVRYAPLMDNTPGATYDVEEGIQETPQRKMEDSMKYETTADQLDSATASRGALKSIQKYSRG